MIKAVLFDMDGVLAFTEQFYTKRRLAFLAEHGVVLETVPDWTGASDDSVWKSSVPDPPLRRRLREEYRIYADEHPTPWRDLANSQAQKTFSFLKERGIRTAICSSSWRSLIEEFMNQAGLCRLVDFVISGAECPRFKPAPDIYQIAMEHLDVLPEQTIVVEDSPIGIEAGKRSGAFVCALRQPGDVRLEQGGADVVINQLFEVTEFVRCSGSPV